jgi:hypothetical protein
VNKQEALIKSLSLNQSSLKPKDVAKMIALHEIYKMKGFQESLEIHQLQHQGSMAKLPTNNNPVTQSTSA